MELNIGRLQGKLAKHKDKTEAETISASCKGQRAIVKTVERKEKSEKAPAYTT